MAKRVTARQVKRNGKKVWRVLTPIAHTGGKQQARYFRLKEDALAHAAYINGQQSKGPVTEFQALDPATQDHLLRALRAIGGDAKALELAAAQFLKTKKERPDLTLAKLIEECLESKRAANLSHRGLGNLRCSLDAFASGLGPDQLVATITTEQIEDWLNAQGWSPTTRRGRLVDVKTLLNFAVGRKWIAENPADEVTKPKAAQAAVGILKPEEAAKLMHTAREEDPGLVPYLALSLFAGLRPEREAARIQWEEIRNGHLTMNSENAKGRKKRIIPINDTLKAWLALGGDLPPRNLKKRLEQVRQTAGIAWSHDCMRHSFVSYAYPIWGEIEVAQWSGHSQQVLHDHYRALVSKEEAQAFWAIKPS